MIRMETPDLELKGLNGFIGTQNYYQYMGVLFTDGIRYIMENGYSWFVTDAIAVIIADQKIRRHLQKDDFLTIKLKLTAENEADMIITDGNDTQLYRQHYDFTDAKKDLKLFYTGNTLMLASEY
jgi:NAD kinase